jgi:hypothetical protein
LPRAWIACTPRGKFENGLFFFRDRIFRSDDIGVEIAHLVFASQ